MQSVNSFLQRAIDPTRINVMSNVGDILCPILFVAGVVTLVWWTDRERRESTPKSKPIKTDERPPKLLPGTEHFCSKCQTKNPPGAKFCKGCGEKFA